MAAGADTVCAFCGLLCDDLGLERRDGALAVRTTACPRAADGFARWSETLDCSVAGQAATREAALAAATRLLAAAHRPLVAGLTADVEAQRVAIAIADRFGGIIDHAGSAGFLRNLSVTQDTGMMSATLAEVRVRSDLLVLVGPGTVRGFPRLLERVGTAEGRSLICLGWTPEPSDLDGWSGPAPEALGGDMGALAEIAATLRALAAGRRVADDAVGDITLPRLAGLAERLKSARYSVIAWAAEEIDGPAPALAVHQLVELVRDLNAATRCAGLPLGGSGNAMGAHQALHWQTGSGLRTAFTADGPLCDPHQQGWQRTLRTGEADLLLWVSTLGGPPVPATDGVPVIAVAAPGTRFAGTPDVVLAAGRPGVDHDGWAFRTDGVVSLRMRAAAAASAGHPSAAAILNDLLTAAGPAGLGESAHAT